MKVIGSNPSYLLKTFLLYPSQCWSWWHNFTRSSWPFWAKTSNFSLGCRFFIYVFNYIIYVHILTKSNFQYSKTNSKLPLIEENAEVTGLGSGCSGASSEVVSSGSTLRQMNSPKRHANAQQRPLSLPPKPQIKFLRKTKSLSTPNGSKQGK